MSCGAAVPAGSHPSAATAVALLHSTSARIRPRPVPKIMTNPHAHPGNAARERFMTVRAPQPNRRFVQDRGL
jgi:hypothetical protein